MKPASEDALAIERTSERKKKTKRKTEDVVSSAHNLSVSPLAFLLLSLR